MSDPSSAHFLPAWQTLHEDNFLRYGLIAERNPIDGRVDCNLHILGGLAGRPVCPTWGKPGGDTFLLALSVVHKVCSHPDPHTAPMAPHLTQSFMDGCRMTAAMHDGTKIPAPYLHIANLYQWKALVSDGARDPNSLTIPMEDILVSLTRLVKTHYPD